MSQTEEGKKFDGGKSPLYIGCINYFPRSLLGVADISQYGVNKYGVWGGWRSVPDGIRRYTDADLRHITLEAFGLYDEESHMAHALHHAWNALARADKMLEDGIIQVYDPDVKR